MLAQAFALVDDDLDRHLRARQVGDENEVAAVRGVELHGAVEVGARELPRLGPGDEERSVGGQPLERALHSSVELPERVVPVVLGRGGGRARTLEDHEGRADEVHRGGREVEREVRAVVREQPGVARLELRIKESRLAADRRQQVRRESQVEHLLGDDAHDQPRRLGVRVLDRVHRVQVWRDRRELDPHRDREVLAKLFGRPDGHDGDLTVLGHGGWRGRRGPGPLAVDLAARAGRVNPPGHVRRWGRWARTPAASSSAAASGQGSGRDALPSRTATPARRPPRATKTKPSSTTSCFVMSEVGRLAKTLSSWSALWAG